MLRGLYTAASGLNAELFEQDVVANNIANSTTVAFKKDTPLLESFPNRLMLRIQDRLDKPCGPIELPPIVEARQQPQPLGFMGQGVQAAETATEFTAGSLTQTNQPLDFALKGNALFMVQRGDGSFAYTRAGNFTLNSAQQLATLGGDVVMGASMKPIVLNGGQLGQNVVVDTGGGVHLNGQYLSNLALVPYDPTRFSKVGDGLFVRDEPPIEALSRTPVPTPPDVEVMQGYIEQSNVQIVTEMVRMISLMRAYETNTKAMTMQDQTLSQLVTSVGTPA